MAIKVGRAILSELL